MNLRHNRRYGAENINSDAQAWQELWGCTCDQMYCPNILATPDHIAIQWYNMLTSPAQAVSMLAGVYGQHILA